MHQKFDVYHDKALIISQLGQQRTLKSMLENILSTNKLYNIMISVY